MLRKKNDFLVLLCVLLYVLVQVFFMGFAFFFVYKKFLIEFSILNTYIKCMQIFCKEIIGSLFALHVRQLSYRIDMFSQCS